jgi:hypothetical protein
MTGNSVNTADYDGQHTLIVGEVNSGKTRLTESILAAWVGQGRSADAVVLDLAPVTGSSIGGRLRLPVGFQGVCLTADLVPPRLSARTEEEAETLAAANAQAIEKLFEDPRLAASGILVINDVTLYLQAGDYDRLRSLIQPVETVLINAYYGHSFPDYRLSRIERRLTDRLIQDSHRIIRLPWSPTAD